ncbi:ribosomal protein L7/L12 [Mycolicibacterium sp. P9-22]|uniref:ribosomal protein L7/L12 n=1 Tax=Mycolicibacterium sp. P9-22 TaxID=2024613 RepID=UPI0011F0785E|nr:ribosomal protein L7/L12 [Mycolicibacterium sp. P9-22]KAA0113626.1 50S ribosomal protein L12 [Mycolicibacterium sp. P9-22]
MGLFGGSDDDLQRRVEELERRVAALERALNTGHSPRPSGELTDTSGSEILAPQSGVTEMVRQLAIQGNKIAAIKLLRDETGMGLREAKNAVERLT